jgi:protein SCO1/2
VRAPRFELTDERGDRIAMADFRGGPAIVTFLYTHCEDTCPPAAQQVKGALNELGRDVPALAIAVDPPNDTAASARAFLSKQRMLGRMRFVLGTRAELEPVWRGFAIAPQRADAEHQARIVLVDGDGLQRIGFPIEQATPERIAHDVRLLESLAR